MSGLCVTPVFFPDRAEREALRPTFQRSILYSLDDLDSVLLPSGEPLLLTVNNECREVGENWEGWARTIKAIAERSRGQVFGICCGNEFDKFWLAREDDVPPSFAANLVRQAKTICRQYGIKVIATSVVSPKWPEYLGRTADLCRDDADYFDLHPYGQRPDGFMVPGWGNGELRQALMNARQIAGKPIIMSEVGVTHEMAGGEDGVARYMVCVDDTVKALGAEVVPFYSWFAWCDQIGAPEEQGEKAFGLRRANNLSTAAWTMFQSINAPAEPEEPEEPPAETGTPIISAWRHLWQAANPTLPYNEEIAGFGIPTYWRSHFLEMGSPLSPEIGDVDGTVLQTFTLGIYRWTGNSVERI